MLECVFGLVSSQTKPCHVLPHMNQSAINRVNWKTAIKSVLLTQHKTVIEAQLFLLKGHWKFSVIFRQYYGCSAEPLHRNPSQKRGPQGISHYSVIIQIDNHLKM